MFRRSHHRGHKRRFRITHPFIATVLSVILLIIGFGAIWIATLPMPDLQSFDSRKTGASTKIYDRTGTTLLFDMGKDKKRTAVPLTDISPFIQKGTIAIEDSNFYNNIGIEPTSIIRATLANLLSVGYSQGASTLTQQVVKNSLLTKDKTLTRKIKEWVLAIKLTRSLSKNDILLAYLNETSYGGTIYGVEEASNAFFGHPAKDVSLAEAAYLAAIPQAPTYYSPYGTHKDALDNRQRIVLARMLELGVITKDQYSTALKEKVTFLSKNDASIRAPHFVMMVSDYLSQKYGEDVSNQGLKVITSLDYSLQQKAEEVVKKFAPTIEQNFNASNTAMVAIDPKTGDILTMLGSRNYFDKKIEGNFNVALAKRQPGSTFKPFVYATLFEKGYTPETILFDVKTEFSTQCTVEGKPKNPSDDPEKVCYSPDEFDNAFPGPMPIRYALAQSRNVPAVKALYLAGIQNAIRTAESMGITSLTDPDRYGLTLVLGGGEVSLLDLTSAYGVFANDGVRNPYRSVLEVDDQKGNALEKVSGNPSQVISSDSARQISDILSDNSVRLESLKPIGQNIGRPVAIKTGTTNDYRDVWTMGYTPNLVVGAWAGRNDNTPMQHNVAGLIISPLWGAFMSQAVQQFPVESFKAPPAKKTDNKPVLHGVWQGGISYWIDKVSGKVATAYTPPETREERVFNNVHTILHWVDKNDPNGPVPKNPSDDSQYQYWEYGVRKWFTTYQASHPEFKETTVINIPTATDDIHGPDSNPQVQIISPVSGSAINPAQRLNLQIRVGSNRFIPQKTELYVNGKYILTTDRDPLNISFIPSDVANISDGTPNTISVTVYDSAYNKGQASVDFVTQ